MSTVQFVVCTAAALGFSVVTWQLGFNYGWHVGFNKHKEITDKVWHSEGKP